MSSKATGFGSYLRLSGIQNPTEALWQSFRALGHKAASPLLLGVEAAQLSAASLRHHGELLDVPLLLDLQARRHGAQEVPWEPSPRSHVSQYETEDRLEKGTAKVYLVSKSLWNRSALDGRAVACFSQVNGLDSSGSSRVVVWELCGNFAR